MNSTRAALDISANESEEQKKREKQIDKHFTNRYPSQGWLHLFSVH